MEKQSQQQLETPSKLKTLIAGVGSRSAGTACLVSAAAWIAGEDSRVKDAPECVCPVIRGLSIQLNDGPWWGSDGERTAALLPLAHKIINTRGSFALEKKRIELVLRWLQSDVLPRAFGSAASALESAASALDAKLPEHAAKLREHAGVLREQPSKAAGFADAAAARYAADAAAHAAADADARAADLRMRRREARDGLQGLIVRLCEVTEAA